MTGSFHTAPAVVSVVVPAKNEAKILPRVLAAIRDAVPEAQIIVVNDGSSDDTEAVCTDAHLLVIKHLYSIGNGGAIKSGARAAVGDVVVFLDADGQHDPKDIPRLLSMMSQGYAMVVGARDARSHASLGRRVANGLYNRLASWIVGHPIADLTSGFRAVNVQAFREFLHLLPNGFSYPTTITMAFFRSGYPVAYVPIEAGKRTGKSHISPMRDGVRFLLIIFKIGTLYSPLKVFVPIASLFFLSGFTYYVYTFIYFGRFTNMSALLLSTSVVVLLIGMVSEQITQLIYSKRGD